MLVAAGLLITPHEAHAGQWRLATSSELAGKANCQGSNEYSGTSTGHADAIVGIPGTGSSGTGPSDAVDTSVTWGIPGSGSNPMPQTVAYPSCNKGYAHFKGKVRAWFVYVPNPLKDANGRPKLDAQGNPDSTKYDVNGRVQRFSVKTSPATEIPQEGFEDEYSNDEVRWSPPKGGILGTGFPTPSTPQPTKPPAPSYSYS